jgi:hypothetical protein
MKNKPILFLILMSIQNLFGQVNLDVWKMSKKQSSTVEKNLTIGQLPKNFESTSPDKKTLNYSKVRERTIKVELSDGRKFDYTPILYKSSDGSSVISYSEKNGWVGYYIDDNNNYSLRGSTVVKNESTDSLISKTITSSVEQNFCNTLNHNTKQISKKTPSKTPTSSNTLTNADFYNPSIIIPKRCSLRVEVSYSTHQSYGGGDIDLTEQYFTTLYEGVTTLFAKEGIILNMTQLFVWLTPDNYSTEQNQQSTTLLNYSFQRPLHPEWDHFNQLILSSGVPWGIAYFNGAANGSSNPSPSLFNESCLSVCNIGTSSVGTNYPESFDYFIPIHIATHELGHNLGSRHTHWCGWKDKFNNYTGPLDRCFTVEPSTGSPCDNTGLPLFPTIMSYCHINQTTAIKNALLKNGFGDYPRWSIRNNLYYSDDIPFITPSGDAPTVVTGFPSDITQTSFKVLESYVSSDGGSPILQKGICWSNGPNPNLSDNKILDLSTNDIFTVSLQNLFGGEVFYVRAFATNENGTSFGEEKVIMTQPPTTPNVILSNISNITQTSATFLGQVSGGYGGNIITKRGVCWSTTPNPTINNSFQELPSTGSNSWSGTVSQFSPSTTYYVRSYTGNDGVIFYSSQQQFTTLSDAINFTTNIVSRRYRSISTNVNLTGTNGNQILERGVCWSYTNPNPTVDDQKVLTSTNLGIISTTIGNLIENRTVYIRPYFMSLNNQSFYGTTITTSTLNPNLTISNQGLSVFNLPIDEYGSVPYTQIDFSSAPFPGNGFVGDYGIIAAISNQQLDINNSDYLSRYKTTPTRVVFGNYPAGQPQTPITTGIYLPSGTQMYVRGYYRGEYGQYYYTTVIQVTTPCSSKPQIKEHLNPSYITNYPSIWIPSVDYNDRNLLNNRNFVGGHNSSLLTIFAPRSCPNSIVKNVGWLVKSPSQFLDNLTFTNSDSIKPYVKEGDLYHRILTLKDFVREPLTTLYSGAQSRIYKRELNGNLSTLEFGSGQLFIGSFPARYAPRLVLEKLEVLSYNEVRVRIRVIDVGGILPSQNGFGGLGTITRVGYYVYKTEKFTSIQSGTQTGPDIVFDKRSESVCVSNCSSEQSFDFVIQGLNQNQSYNIVPYAESSVQGQIITKTWSPTPIGQTPQLYPIPLGINCPEVGISWNIKFKISDFNKIETTQPINTLQGTILSGGNVITSSSDVISRGVCWSTSQNPDISLNTKTVEGSGLGIFYSNLTELNPNTLYYIRSYFTTSTGVFYGEQKTITTISPNTPPNVQTGTATGIFQTSQSDTWQANITGQVISTSSPIIEMGFVYSKFPNPILYDGQSIKVPKTETESFKQIKLLSPSTLYYFRFFALNQSGVSYGSVVQFTTGGLLPVITTLNPVIMSLSSVSCGGNISNQGASPVVQRGLIWSTSPDNITIDLPTKSSNGVGVGQYIVTIPNLPPSNTFYIKAYARNNSGVNYGNMVSIRTPTQSNTNCNTTGLNVYQQSTIKGLAWFSQFSLNPNCQSYKVEVSKYSSNPTINPNLQPIQTSVINNANPYYPTQTDIDAGYVKLLMRPQPTSMEFGTWYSLNVKCNGSCVSTPVTKFYFFVPPQ